MSFKTDMHLHTYYSDGTMSPTDIVKRAKGLDYDIIAITDHDTIGGVSEAMIAGHALDIKVIPGIELSADIDRIGVHILGYRIDLNNVELMETLNTVLKRREDRNERLLKALQEMGLNIKFEDLNVRAECGYVGKPIIARALVKKGYTQTVAQAFEAGKFLESPEAKAVKKQKLTAKQAIDLILRAGGMSVLAHPMRIKGLGERESKAFYENVDALIVKLKKIGLSGLECYHTDHTHEEALWLVEMAGKYKMHITEGSDYHGSE